MANLKNLIDDIKKDLAKFSPADRKMTSKQIIEELVEDIYAQLKSGARLDDIYAIISKKLTDETKMSLSTFKRYWREARDGAGLSKIKNSGRMKIDKIPSEPSRYTTQGATETTQEPPIKQSYKGTPNASAMAPTTSDRAPE